MVGRELIDYFKVGWEWVTESILSSDRKEYSGYWVTIETINKVPKEKITCTQSNCLHEGLRYRIYLIKGNNRPSETESITSWHWTYSNLKRKSRGIWGRFIFPESLGNIRKGLSTRLWVVIQTEDKDTDFGNRCHP